MSKKSLKQIIYEVLKATNLPVAYRHTDVNVLPRFSYSLIYNGELKLSNKIHSKKLTYQIDYFSRTPVDIETFEVFDEVRDELRAANVATKPWQEVENYDEQTGLALYHYYTECDR